jgi:replicative DNA helicase
VSRPEKVRLAEPPVIAGRVPPCDLDTEASVLNTIFVKGSAALDDVRGILADEDWYSEPNRLIWQACCAVRDAGNDPSPLTAGQWLIDHNLMFPAGGAAYFETISSHAISSAQIVTFAERVRRKARLRRAIATAQHIAAEGYGELDDVDAEAWLESLPDRLRGVESDKVGAFHVGAELVNLWQERAKAAGAGKVVLGPSTGMAELDRRIGGLRGGKVTIVAARSYVGKTAFAFQVGSHVATNGKGVLVHELEAPKDETLDRLHYATAGVDGSRLLANIPLNTSEMGAMNDAARSLKQAPLYGDTRSNVTVTDIRASVRRLARKLERHKIPVSLVIVDYVQLVSARDMSAKGSNREAEVAHISREIKRMAMDLNVHVMVLAQLNKEADKRDSGRPRTSDMRESSAIEMDADHIILLHNPHREERADGKRADEPSDEVEIILAKNRGGKPASIPALWIPSQQCFQPQEPKQW